MDRLVFNIEQIRNSLPSKTKIMAVVKADGYGHGDRMIAKTLSCAGVDFFAVSNLDEALSLRNAGITAAILILGFTPAQMAPTLSAQHITQTVFSKEYALSLNEECARNGLNVDIHIKVDTGMNRIGITENESHSALADIKEICALPALAAEGIFTHLSSADILDETSISYTERQVAHFIHVVTSLAHEGCQFPLKHLQNSAGIAFLPDLAYDYVRAGIVMYGVAPSDEELPLTLKPVMELKSVISMVKEIDAGSAISYGRRFISEKKMKIATVPIGYADGYPRLLSNKADMLIKGKRARVLGNICMDQLMLDVSDIDDVKMGDIVTVVGQDGDECIGFGELARITGSISYELMCLIGRRVPRVYQKEGQTVAVVDYIQG